MTLYDDYRKKHPLQTIDHPYREVMEEEIKKALEYRRMSEEEASDLVDELLAYRVDAFSRKLDSSYDKVKELKARIIAGLTGRE